MAGLLQRYRVSAEPQRSERRMELVVLALALLCVLVLGYQLLRLFMLQPPAPRMPSADSLSVAELVATAEVDAQQRVEVQSRPLFWQGRRPLDGAEVVVKKPPTSTPTAADTTLKTGNIDNVRLVGVFGEGATAGIIAVVAGVQQRINVGDSVDGWKLRKIELDRAFFRNGGSNREVLLERSFAVQEKQQSPTVEEPLR